VKSHFRDVLLAANSRMDQNKIGSTRPCKLCLGTAYHFCVVDFNKSCNMAPLNTTNIGVEYFKCRVCELIFTDFFDDWKNDDFKSLIYNDEYLVVDPDYAGARSVANAELFARVLEPVKGAASLLDYDGGGGGFALEMERRGFVGAQSYDPYGENQQLAAETFDIVTAFEVIEHSTNPAATLDEILRKVSSGGLVLVGQTIQPEDIDDIRADWWYIAPRNGHVSFYSHKTLLDFAKSRGLIYRYIGGSFILYRPDTSNMSNKILDGLPSVVEFVSLGAPCPQPCSLGEWHEVENETTQLYRWTAAEEVSLGEVFLEAKTIVVTLPYLMSIGDEFVRGCRLRIGSETAELRPTDLNSLVGTVTLNKPARYQVIQKTPPLRSPVELGLNTDARKLGIAIPCQIP